MECNTKSNEIRIPNPPTPPRAQGGSGDGVGCGLGIHISCDFVFYFIVFQTPFYNTLSSFLIKGVLVNQPYERCMDT